MNLPDSLTEIADYGFLGCSSLEEIAIPGAVTRIGTSAFYESGIHQVSFTGESSLISIADYAFRGCTALTTFDIPEGTTSVGYSAFNNCSNLEMLIVPDSVTSMESDSVEKTDKLVMYVNPDSYAEQFAIDNEIPYEYITSLGHSVTLSVKNTQGKSVSSGFTAYWYSADGSLLGTGTKLRNIAAGSECRCGIVLGEELSYLFSQPEDKTFIAGEQDETVVFVLEEIEKCIISGTINDSDGEIISHSTVNLKQTYTGGYEKTLTAESNDDGVFVFDAYQTESILTVTKDGYYSRSFKFSKNELSDENCNLNIILTGLPTDKIQFSLKKIAAAESGTEGKKTSLINCNGLEFSLYNKTKDKAITDFEVQYPYITINNDEASPKDDIQINAVDIKNKMTADPVTITLDESKCGYADMCFLENGRLKLTNISGNTKNTVLIFDEDGNCVSSGTATTDYEGPALSEGNYDAVLITKSSLLSSVNKKEQLTEYGLSDGIDYVERTITIHKGLISTLSGIQVPCLDVSKLYYTVSDSTFMTANPGTVVTGKYVTIQSRFEINPKYSTTQQKVDLQIPDGTTFVGGSLTVNGKKSTYTQNGNTVTVIIGVPKGILRFYLLPITTGKKQIFASLTFNKNDDIITQPIGSSSFNVTAATINVPKKAGQKTIVATGKAIDSCEITVFDNGKEVGTTYSNKNGTWKCEFDLVDPLEYSIHEIHAVVHSNTYDVNIETESSELVFESSYSEVSKVTMINTAHPSNSIKPTEFQTVFDFLNPTGAIPQYNYWPSYPTFTFIVEFSSRNEGNIRDVYVVTKDSTGDATFVECTFDSSEGVWIGTHDYLYFSDVPHVVNVCYDCDTNCIDGSSTYAQYQRNQDAWEFDFEESGSNDSAYTWTAINDELQSSMTVTGYESGSDFSEFDTDVYVQKGYEIVYDSADVVALSNKNDQMVLIIPSSTNKALVFEGDLQSVVRSSNSTKSIREVLNNKMSAAKSNGRICDKCNDFTGQDILRIAQDYITENGIQNGIGVTDPNEYLLIQDFDRARAMQVCAMGSVVLHAGSLLPVSSKGSGQAEQMGSHLGNAIFNSASNTRDAARTLSSAETTFLHLLYKHLKDLGKFYSCSGGKDCNCGGSMCNCDKNPEIDDGGEGCLPIADPSGYIFEAVPSNRIEGVKAEIYQFDYTLDEYGVLSDEKSEIVWDAENYDQINPQYTDAYGTFGWDVPQGQWVVKFSKDGYEDADSYHDPAVDEEGYLPVPPIQTEVNTAIVSKAAPVVSNVKAYQEQIRIDFSQYMQIDTVNTTNVRVSIGGKNVQGTIEPLNAEDNYEKTAQYASSYAFIPDEALSGTVAVSVSGVKSYNGKAISDAYNQTADVTIMPEKLEITGGSVVGHHESAEMEIRILPAEAGANRTVTITSYSPSIVSAESQTVTTDENGAAKVILNGKLPGEGILIVSLEGTDLSEEIKVLVKAKETVSALENLAEQITFETDSFVYTGSQITPAVTIPGLTEGTDFTVAYSDNVKVGTATVTITGIGKYTGTVTKTFEISPASVSKAVVTGIKAKTYNGKAQTQSPVVKVGSNTLVNKTDYTLTYKNNTNAGTATVTIKGKGNYTGSISKTFKINKAAQKPACKTSVVSVGKTGTFTITGSKGKLTVTSSNTKIVAISKTDQTNKKVTVKGVKVGTVKLTIKAAAATNYNAASVSVTLKIVPAATAKITAVNLAKGIKLTWAKVAGANGYIVYRNSKKIKTITTGTTVTFTDTAANTNGTKYTYKIVANASTGTSTLSKSLSTYRVAPPAVKTLKNSASKKMTVTWGKNAKANGYQIQYSTSSKFKSGNKTANITKAGIVSKVIGSLAKSKTYYVRIRTYKTVGKTKYWSSWSAAKKVKISK